MVGKLIERTPSAYNAQLLLKHLLVTPIARESQEEVVYGDTRFSYPELIQRVNRLANVLDEAGVPEAATVAVMDWDSHRYLECYFAIPAGGRILQTVNVRLSPEQILYTLNWAGADTLIVNRDFLEIVDAIVDRLESVKRFILIDEVGDPIDSPLQCIGEYEALSAKANNSYDFPEFSEDTQATIFFTTGTTGDPKGVYYSHRQIVLHVLASLATFGTAAAQGRVGTDDVYMPVTPMFHAHAWGWPYAATLLGIRQVYPGVYEPGKLIELIEREGVSFSHCVPTLLHMILEDKRSAGIDFSGRKFLVGGSAIPAALVELALKRGVDLFTGYGMSETGPVQVINHLTEKEVQLPQEEQIAKRQRAGRPVMLCDVRTIDDDGNTLPKDGKSVGEVVFRSPWLTQGYHNKPEQSERLWRNGWLHSGDLGCFNPDGSLEICDREKDVIKSGGEWISSLELENILSTHPDINEVAVIAESDPKWGERPAAVIVTSGGRDSIDSSELIQHCKQYVDVGVISRYAVPQRFLFVDEINKTSVGKFDKKALRDKYGSSVR